MRQAGSTLNDNGNGARQDETTCSVSARKRANDHRVQLLRVQDTDTDTADSTGSSGQKYQVIAASLFLVDLVEQTAKLLPLMLRWQPPWRR